MKLVANHLLREGLLPRSVVSRQLEGNAPTIDAAVGYNRTNTSSIPKPFLSLLDELMGTAQTRQTQ
jgi:LysR family hca operon transcriptional activator